MLHRLSALSPRPESALEALHIRESHRAQARGRQHAARAARAVDDDRSPELALAHRAVERARRDIALERPARQPDAARDVPAPALLGFAHVDHHQVRRVVRRVEELRELLAVDLLHGTLRVGHQVVE